MHKMEALVILLLPTVFTFSLSLTDQAPPACDSQTPTDVILVIDSSNSVGYDNFRTQLQFMANVTRHFNIGSDRFRFAALAFSTGVQKLFDLRTYQDTVWIDQALLDADYDAASTNIAGALKFITDDGMFNGSAGGREMAKKHVRIVVLITDGGSDNPNETIQQALALHQQHVHVVAIGVGITGGNKEFTNIVNNPRNTFTADSYDVLNLLEMQVVNRICDSKYPVFVKTVCNPISAITVCIPSLPCQYVSHFCHVSMYPIFFISVCIPSLPFHYLCHLCHFIMCPNFVISVCIPSLSCQYVSHFCHVSMYPINVMSACIPSFHFSMYPISIMSVCIQFLSCQHVSHFFISVCIPSLSFQYVSHLCHILSSSYPIRVISHLCHIPSLQYPICPANMYSISVMSSAQGQLFISAFTASIALLLLISLTQIIFILTILF
ncbi:unnamed protein product [Lymnaea stagnalis]|uniref:VWFA domain-containing protein n=1 Tax=Lymnaea stagnalis TaxID=6523 RepID=A0AAV2H446_LYMST